MIYVIITIGAVFFGAVICAALEIGGGKLKAKNLLLCTAAGLLLLLSVLLPFLLGAFGALLKYARNNCG